MSESLSARVLVVDDEPRLAASVATALRRSGYACEVAACGDDALRLFEARSFDVVVTDWRMPGMDGITLMRTLHTLSPGLPVILVTAYGDVPSAVSAMREGAFDYVTKPFDNDELRALIARALTLRTLQQENTLLRKEVGVRVAADIVAASPAMRTLLELVDRVATSRATVLIQGESGTGKEVIARRIHYLSDRVARPFIAINCKAFAAGVLESELFGHERGAFTGAVNGRAGCFERAHTGTLFLDEIGEIDLDFQAKLLRVLQEGEVQRVGATGPRKVNVRIVAATNRDLRTDVASGKFREDLYFRLCVIPLQLPPLRARTEDILLLAEYFLDRFRHEARRTLTLSPETEAVILTHTWPGNVRELENTIERATVLARGESITPEDLLLETITPHENERAVLTETLQAYLDRVTIEKLRATLRAVGNRRNEAASVLGIERTTLYRLLKRYGLG